MTDFDREAYRRYVVEPMQALAVHVEVLEACLLELAPEHAKMFEHRLAQTRAGVHQIFAKMQTYFAPVERGE